VTKTTHCRVHQILLVGLIAAALAACTKPGPPPSESPPDVELALSTVPDNVFCVAVTIATDHTDRRRFDVVPGKPASFLLKGLKVGVTVFSIDAFPRACKDSNATATWTGGPVTVTLLPGRNPTIVIQLTPTSEVTVTIGFGSGNVPTCAAGGSACTGHADCCSKWCSLPENKSTGIGTCRADEPPSPTSTDLVFAPEILDHVHGRATYPGFDGDFFMVTFPRQAKRNEDPDDTADQVRNNFVFPALLATGLTQGRLTTIQTPPSAPFELAQGQFAPLVENACRNFNDSDQAEGDTCRTLRAPDVGATPGGPPRANVLARMDATVGMSSGELRAEIQRPLKYWTFSQRERDVPIEHKGAVVLQPDGLQVTAVFGAVLNRTLITNEIAFNAPTAIGRGMAILERIERARLAPSKHPARQATLVLLPYGAAPAVPGRPTAGVTALRFAYRVGMDGVQATGNTTIDAAYSVWVDAATGDVLKYVAEAAEATVGFAPFCRDPAETGGQCFMNLNLMPSSPATPEEYTLSSQSPFRLSPAGATSPYPVQNPGVLFPARPAPDQLCSYEPADPPAFRPANAFAQLTNFHKLLTASGTLSGLDGIEVVVDAPGAQNMATFPPKLSFISGVVNDPLKPGQCSANPRDLLPGALDATILAHEYAHLATMHLQTSNPPSSCGSANCSTADPYNRQFFHDYSDGVAALLTGTPCIGGWAAKNTTENYSGSPTGNPTRDDVARACADSSEGSGLPRLLTSDDAPDGNFVADVAFKGMVALRGPPLKDTFPTRRFADEGSSGAYGNGQIVGAALWHTWEGLKSQNSMAATLPLWGYLTKAIWATGFTNTVNAVADENSDLNVYRSGRELLVQLANSWAASLGTQSMNKLLSAFARAGIFLTPSSCLLSTAGTTQAQLDPTFCKTERTGADAIIDIDDGDHSEFVGGELGIKIAENDYVKLGGNGPGMAPAKFRIWTGADFSFNDLGRTPRPGEPNPVMCNDGYRVSVRRRLLRTAPPLPWSLLTTGSTKGKCYAEELVDTTVLERLLTADKAFTTFEYKVETYRVSDGANPRSSDNPGNGLWSNTPTSVRPNVFYLTDTGKP
jgi:hypothetical protein